jgi:hypothetical protein
MARTIDPRKIARWRRWKNEYDNSEMSVVEFSEKKRVSVAATYWWFRRLKREFGDELSEPAAIIEHPQPKPIEPMPMPPTTPQVAVQSAARSSTPLANPMILYLPGGAKLEISDLATAQAMVRELTHGGNSQ